MQNETINKKRFKPEVIELIKRDPVLYAKVSQALNILPGSLNQTLIRNGASLNQYSAVTVVSEYTGKKPDELVEDLVKA